MHRPLGLSLSETADVLRSTPPTVRKLIDLGWLPATQHPGPAGRWYCDPDAVHRLAATFERRGAMVADGYLTVREAADRLGVAMNTLHRLVNKGHLPIVAILYKRRIFREADVERLANDWPKQRLSTAQVREIYRRCHQLAGKETIAAIAREMGLHYKTVASIRDGVYWAWATGHKRQRRAA